MSNGIPKSVGKLAGHIDWYVSKYDGTGATKAFVRILVLTKAASELRRLDTELAEARDEITRLREGIEDLADPLTMPELRALLDAPSTGEVEHG